MAVTIAELRNDYGELIEETINILDTLRNDRKIGGDKYVELLAIAIPEAMRSATMFALDSDIKDKEKEKLECEIAKCNYELTHLYPKKLEMIDSEISFQNKKIDQITCEISRCEYEVEWMLPTERQKILMDIAVECSQKAEIDYKVATWYPKEIVKLTADIAYLEAQEEFMDTKKSEMILDGVKDRESKAIVDNLHNSQIELYGRQKESFDDKRQTDIVSKLLDVWTVEATNTIDANAGIAYVTKPNVEDKSPLEVVIDKYVGTDEELATKAPTVVINGDNPLNLNVGDTYNEAGATATDSQGNNLPVTIGGDTVDTGNAGTYNVTYTATDSDNLTTVTTREVIVS